jgi:hypothetical protein
MALAMVTAGCSSNNGAAPDAGPAGCTNVASADQLCLGQPCDLTWAEVEGDQSFCSFEGGGLCFVLSCGQVQAISCFGVDYGNQYYFASGALVERVGYSQGVRECWVLGPVDITANLSCGDAAAPTQPPPWCADAGTP